MNKIKKVGLYGGGFDPIHLGHKELIDFVIEQCDFDEIWLMPAYAHTFNKNMIDCSYRIDMCNLVKLHAETFDNKGTKILVSDFEGKYCSMICL